jgi:hypothetical protein
MHRAPDAVRVRSISRIGSREAAWGEGGVEKLQMPAAHDASTTPFELGARGGALAVATFIRRDDRDGRDGVCGASCESGMEVDPVRRSTGVPHGVLRAPAPLARTFVGDGGVGVDDVGLGS